MGNGIMAEGLLNLECRGNLNLEQGVPHRQPPKQKPHQFGTTNEMNLALLDGKLNLA